MEITVQVLLTVVMAAITFSGLYWVVGLSVLVSGLVAIVLALLGMFLFVIEIDGGF